MRATESASRSSRFRAGLFWLGTCAILGAGGVVAAAEPASKGGTAEQGKELFLREWTLSDARSHGGDGLGPVFNDSSCVACHNAGAPGGAGPASKNVDIITAFSNRGGRGVSPQTSTFLNKALEALTGIESPHAPDPNKSQKPDTTELIKAHAGFRTARSVVLHRFGADPKYEAWRLTMMGLGHFARVDLQRTGSKAGRADAEIASVKQMAQVQGNMRNTQGQAGEFTLTRSQRNPTALFGAGLIDSIPDDVLLAAAEVKHPDYPEVIGRVSRQKDQRIGRFGWKAQTASLKDFVLTACAVELGLEVPGHSQGGLPQSPDYKSKGLDLNAEECAALIAYVSDLPRPIEHQASNDAEGRDLAAGKTLMASVGCTACHTPKLGNVESIYSDLLLHDMGSELGDTGAYGVFTPGSDDADFIDEEGPLARSTNMAITPDGTTVVTTTPTATVHNPAATAAKAALARKSILGATRQEWRTPPLWGLRDSGPYLHDGRADTIDQAVALHGGQGVSSARKYFMLSASERAQLQAFLKSLIAPVEHKQQLVRADD